VLSHFCELKIKPSKSLKNTKQSARFVFWYKSVCKTYGTRCSCVTGFRGLVLSATYAQISTDYVRFSVIFKASY